MKIDLESCFVGFLIGVAIYLLVNRVFIVEGVTGNACSVENCNKKCIGKEQCFCDNTCPGLGCDVRNIDKCRFCGFGEYSDIDCGGSSPSPSPSSTPSPSPSSTPSPSPLSDSELIELTNIIKTAHESTDDVNNISLKFSFDTLDSYNKFKDLLDRNTKNSFINLYDQPYNVNRNDNPIYLTFTFNVNNNYPDIDNLDISYIVKIVNLFEEDIKGITLFFESYSIVTGELSSLSGLSDLIYLDLNYTPVAGELKDLKDLSDLKSLSLNHTHVAGELKDLKDLSDLKSLSLNYTPVAGELKDLKDLSDLKSLSLSDTHVAGELKDLKDLIYLDLNYTPVAGELKDLKDLSDLISLYLSHTHVAGELSSLSGLSDLMHLDLRGTHVTGKLKDLEKLTNLQMLYLCPNSNIKGVISDIAAIKNAYMKGYTDLDYCEKVTDK